MKKVKVYTIEGCNHCDMVENILRSHKIKFKLFKLTGEDEKIEERFKKITGRDGAIFPVIKVGKEAIIGLDMIEIEKHLKLTGKPEKNVDDDVELEDVAY